MLMSREKRRPEGTENVRFEKWGFSYRCDCVWRRPVTTRANWDYRCDSDCHWRSSKTWDIPRSCPSRLRSLLSWFTVTPASRWLMPRLHQDTCCRIQVVSTCRRLHVSCIGDKIVASLWLVCCWIQRKGIQVDRDIKWIVIMSPRYSPQVSRTSNLYPSTYMYTSCSSGIHVSGRHVSWCKCGIKLSNVGSSPDNERHRCISWPCDDSSTVSHDPP